LPSIKSGDALPTGGLATGSIFTTGGGQVQHPANNMLNAKTIQIDLFTTDSFISVIQLAVRPELVEGRMVRPAHHERLG
jgi:hypothetical protein